MSAEVQGGAEGLWIPIGFSLDEAQAALKQLEGEAKRSGEAVKRGVEGGAEGAKKASGGLTELKQNMGRARETAMFFSSALVELGPAGVTAQRAITGVVGAMMGGGGLILAMEGLRIAFDLISSAWKENEERQKKAAEDAKAAAEAYKQWADGVRQVAQGYREQVQALIFGSDAQIVALKEQLAVETDVRKKATLRASIMHAEQARDELKRIESRNRFVALYNESLHNEEKALLSDRDRIAQLYLDRIHIIEQSEAKEMEKREAVARERRQMVRALAEFDDKENTEILRGLQSSSSALAASLSRAVDVNFGLDTKAAVNRMVEGLKFAGDLTPEQIAPLQAFKEGMADFLEDYDKSLAEMRQMTIAALQDLGGQIANEFARGVLFDPMIAGWKRAGTENQRFSREYARLSQERRARNLLESGVVSSMAEAYKVAAGEAKAAEQERLAAEKEAQAERMFGLGMEWSLKAIAAAASYQWPQAAAFGVAATGAFALAQRSHNQAAAMQQGRGYTASENDQIRGLNEQQSSGAREVGGAPSSAGGGANIQVFFSGKALVTEPEVKRYLADLMAEAKQSGWVN